MHARVSNLWRNGKEIQLSTDYLVPPQPLQILQARKACIWAHSIRATAARYCPLSILACRLQPEAALRSSSDLHGAWSPRWRSMAHTREALNVIFNLSSRQHCRPSDLGVGHICEIEDGPQRLPVSSAILVPYLSTPVVPERESQVENRGASSVPKTISKVHDSYTRSKR